MPNPSQANPSKTALMAVWGLVRGVKHWAPVWIPAILLWQFASKGLQPALVEAQRLDRVAPGVEARHAEAQESFEQVEAEAKAWQDPVYRERRRRMRFQDPVEDQPESDEWAAAETPDPQGEYWQVDSELPQDIPELPTPEYFEEPADTPWPGDPGTWVVDQGALEDPENLGLPTLPEATDTTDTTESSDTTEPSGAWTAAEPGWGHDEPMEPASLAPSPQTEPQDTPTSPYLVD